MLACPILGGLSLTASTVPRLRQARRAGWGVTLAAPAGLFVGLAVLFTWPLALHLGTVLPAAKLPDALLQVHRLWFVPRLLAAGRDPYGWTTLLHYPAGARQYLETLIPLVGVLAWPALALGGPLLAYDLAVLALLALNGWCAYLLARDRVGDSGAAVVAGIAYAFSPYLLAHLRVGHLNLVAACCPPLYLLCLLRALERPGPRWPLLAGLCLAATLYTDLQWALALTLLSLPLVAWRTLVSAMRVAHGEGVAAARRAGLRGLTPPRALVHGALAATVALALAAPLLLGIWAEVSAGASAPGANQALRNSAALVAFLAPQPAQPLWRDTVQPWYAAHGLDQGDEQVVALGYLPLALAASGLASPRTRRIGWLLGLLLFVALALGPRLHLASRDVETALPLGLPLPYALLQRLPLVGFGRAPARFAAPATLCLALLAAWGVVALRQRLRRARWVPGLCGLLVALELLPLPFPLSRPDVPGLYQALAAEPCPGPVFELPVEPGSELEKWRLFFQIAHGCPISGGYVSREQQATAIQRRWQEYAQRPAEAQRPAAEALRAELLAAGFVEVAFWREAYASPDEAGREEVALRLLASSPRYDGPDGALYPLR